MSEMISVFEAQELIFQNTYLRPIEGIAIEDLRCEVLRQDLFADRSYPPFPRVAMDGIAIQLASWSLGNRKFKIAGCQKAGALQLSLEDPDSCFEVMTGAPLPLATDCVIRYEDLRIEGGIAEVKMDKNGSAPSLALMQNVHAMGADYNKGDLLVPALTVMNSPIWSIAASIGQSEVAVSQRPQIAIISTGDELVEVGSIPAPYQIRLSNAYTILSSLRALGFTKVTLHHLKDRKTDLLESLSVILDQNDILILSGGVSMGKFDFVPDCLADLKVEKVFHKVRQKPGKPLWFGVSDQQKQVYGLPGNPVSALVCLHRYVLPALKMALGQDKQSSGHQVYGTLSEEVRIKNGLTNFLPVKVELSTDGRIVVTPSRSNGSGDFRSLIGSLGFIELDESQQTYSKGHLCPLYLWREMF